MKLAVADVDRHDLGRAPLQQAVRETAGGRASVESPPADHGQREVVEGGIELVATPADEPAGRPEQLERLARSDESSRLQRRRAADGHPSRSNRGLGLGPVGGQAPAHELRVESAAARHQPERNVSAVIPLSDERASTRPAVVTIGILVICVAVYVFVQPSFGRDTGADTEFNFRHGAIPYELSHGAPLTLCQVARAAAPSQAAQTCARPGGDLAFEPGKPVYLAVVWSMFLHGGIFHIAGNLLFLWVFGRRVEDRLGHVGFTAFYLLSGIVAATAFVLSTPNSTVPFIGASGAIAGVMGAYLLWFPRARINTLFFVFVIIWFRIQARWILLAWFVLQFFTSPNSGIAWVSHVGGFVFGMAVAWVLRPRQPAATP